ncbi:MAG: hypothetical protein LV479_04595 [Methylacidiphilales bacterium]|nr:hypothetical protein [Candidatus Methylacidiphilales bacterium]
MSVVELEKAISELPPGDLSRLAAWFEEFMADEWDKQIARDVAAGKFGHINAKVDKAFEEGRCKPL